MSSPSATGGVHPMQVELPYDLGPRADRAVRDIPLRQLVSGSASGRVHQRRGAFRVAGVEGGRPWRVATSAPAAARVAARLAEMQRDEALATLAGVRRELTVALQEHRDLFLDELIHTIEPLALHQTISTDESMT